MDSNLEQQARQVAGIADVSSPADAVVLYSVSFLPSKENKTRAIAYLREHPEALMIDDTECGRKLIELGMDDTHFTDEGDRQIVAEIWKIASARFIARASGNVTAFVKGADPRSVFRSLELPEILKNPQIKTINGVDKVQFANSVFSA